MIRLLSHQEELLAEQGTHEQGVLSIDGSYFSGISSQGFRDVTHM